MFIQFKHPEYGFVTAFQCDCSEEAVMARYFEAFPQVSPEEEKAMEEALQREMEEQPDPDPPRDHRLRYVDPVRLDRIRLSAIRSRAEVMDYEFSNRR